MKLATFFVSAGLCFAVGCRATGPQLAPPQEIGVAPPSAATDAAGDLEPIDPGQIRPVSFDQPPEPNELPPLLDSSPEGAAAEAGTPETVAPGAFELDDPPPVAMSLADLEQVALQSNPALAQAAAELASLRGKWVQAGLPPNPLIAYQGVEIGNEGRAGLQGAAFTQQIITGHKLQLAQEVVAREVLAAQQRLAATQQRVLTDVRQSYYDVLIAQRKVALLEDLVASAQDAVQASQALLNAQEIPRIGLLQTTVEADNSKILLRRAENESTAAWRNLAAVLGQPRLPPRPLTGDLQHAAEQLNWESEIERLMTTSPELAAAMADIERSRWALDRAHAQAIPDVTVQLGAQYDYGTEDSVANVQIGMPIPVWNRNQGGVQQAEADIVAAQRNFQRVELDLTQRLAAAFQSYATAQYQVAQYQQSILPRAKETYDLVSLGYKQGELGFLEQLTAQRMYFQTNLAYVTALRDLWRATVAIEGQLLGDSLQQAGQ